MKFARAFVREHWSHTMQEKGLEADDLIGIMITNPDHANRSVGVSIDKDFLTLPAKVFNPSHGGKRPIKINKAVADYNWMTQAITGDTVDGYKGIPGVGPKGAEKILDGTIGDVWAMWERVVAAYAEAQLPVEEALRNARYARILRHPDWRATGEIRLFTGDHRKSEWLGFNEETRRRPTPEEAAERLANEPKPKRRRKAK